MVKTKICSVCEESRFLSDFAWRSKEKGTRHSGCKICHRKHRNDYYKNSNDEKKRILESNNKRKKEIRKWFKAFKKSLKCNRCTENRPATLQFHHSDNNSKEKDVSKLVSLGNKERIIEEIKKCEVLCANCHMEHHFGYLYK